VAALGLILILAFGGLSQGFDQPGSFGQPEGARDYETTESPARSSNGFFIHDQVLKIAVIGGLSALALGLLVVNGFRYRRWLLVVSIGVAGFLVGGVLCPLSSVQNIVLKWNTGYLLLFLIPTALALTVGRVFCGSVCPFGAIQELLHVRLWRRRMPFKVRRTLGAAKYGILAYLVTRVIVTGTGVLQGTTPFKALFAWGGTPLSIALTGLFAMLSLVLWRPFCHFFCPLGAFLAVLSRFSLFRLEAQSDCVSCGQCTKACYESACRDGEIRSEDCLLCGRCVTACPLGSFRLAPRWRARASDQSSAPAHH
jgi:polyferredoxin